MRLNETEMAILEFNKFVELTFFIKKTLLCHKMCIFAYNTKNYGNSY